MDGNEMVSEIAKKRSWNETQGTTTGLDGKNGRVMTRTPSSILSPIQIHSNPIVVAVYNINGSSRVVQNKPEMMKSSRLQVHALIPSAVVLLKL